MNGLITEREWLRQAHKRKARPQWWGAQCLYPAQPRQRLRDDRAFWAFMVLLALFFSGVLPLIPPRQETTAVWVQQTETAKTAAVPRHVSQISYEWPKQVALKTETFTRRQLLGGKMLLLNEAHPLPADAPPPNTFSIAGVGKGMIPVAGLDVKCGRETLSALGEWFAALRRQGVSGFSVCHGTLSAAQRKAWFVQKAHTLMQQMPLSQAVAQISGEWNAPGSLDWLQEYTICIRTSDGQALDDTWQGRLLLRLAWRYGFIRRIPGQGNQFRYVGRAHATAMTYLDLSMEEYLDWLHQVGTITVSANGQPAYIIVAKPAPGSHIAMNLPQNAVCEASLDNDGYVVAACTLQK